MLQKIKIMKNNKLFCRMITIFSVLFPFFNFLFFQFEFHFLPMYDLLFIGFYSIVGNIFLFHQNKVVRILFILVNIVSLFIWYWVSLMGYWQGLLLSICHSLIPFFSFWLKIFR